jgi:Skp family chaperone for outer membrane proteins
VWVRAERVRMIERKGRDNMKAWFVTAAIGSLLMAVSVSAQTGTKPAPKPATPTQTTPAAPKPATQAVPPVAQSAQPPRPFPEGAKIAYVDVQQIASESAEGKAARAKIDDLSNKKTQELQEKQKAIQAAQQKLNTGGTVMSDAARDQVEKDIERLQKDYQRAQQDAQEEVQSLTRDLQNDFQRKLLPLIGQVAAEKGLQMVFSAGDSGLVWADTGLNITPDVIKRLNGGGSTAAAPKQ